MTELWDQAIRHIEQLPDSDQDAAAGALLDYLDHRNATQLTDDQVEEVRHRISDPNRVIVPGHETRARIASFGS